MRFYDVQKGRILLDGVDIRDWDLNELRENFAVVLQDVFLFSGSIKDNIRLGNGSINDERIEWAASEVHADEFVRKLDDGYESVVKERAAPGSPSVRNSSFLSRALWRSIRRS